MIIYISRYRSKNLKVIYRGRSMEQRKAVELNSALTSLGFGAWSELESSKYSFYEAK